MMISRANHIATLLPNGQVLVAGGLDSANLPILTAELYDPATGLFTSTGNMNLPYVSQGGAATLLSNGKVLFAGGAIVAGSPFDTEIFDPLTGLFTVITSNVSNRTLPAAMLLQDGRVLLTGGYDTSTGLLTTTAELFYY